MKQFILFTIIAVAISISISYVLTKNISSKEKTGWVNLSVVFNDFTLKKEMEMKLKKTKDMRQTILDSLAFGLKITSKQIQAAQQKDKNKIAFFELKREEYLTKKQQFEEDNASLANQYDSQILAQMNQYVKDFGEKYGYAYIFGADGNGSLMYSVEAANITKEVKEYINKRYKGNTE